jgi:hypothetical protein
MAPTATRSPALLGWETLAIDRKGTNPVGKAVQGGITISVTTIEVLAAKLPSPLYDALRAWLPTPRVEVVIAAVPLTRFAIPTLVPASLKSTVPVAVGGETVAVRVTVWPGADEAGAAVNVVVVDAGFTVSVTGDDLDDALLESPL